MRNRLAIAQLYAQLYTLRAKQTVAHTTEKIVDNKSELTCIAVTTVVVGTVSHVAGFKAGYKFAQAN